MGVDLCRIAKNRKKGTNLQQAMGDVICGGVGFWKRTAVPGGPPPKQTGQRSGGLTANRG